MRVQRIDFNYINSCTYTCYAGVPCDICKTVTEENLLDYPAAVRKFKTCSNLLCYKESRIKCVLCLETFCNSCSLVILLVLRITRCTVRFWLHTHTHNLYEFVCYQMHINVDQKHKRSVDEHNENIFEDLKKDFDQCPNCESVSYSHVF